MRQLESGRDQLMQEQKQLREMQRALKRQEVHQQIFFSLGSDSLRLGRIHVLPKKKGGPFDILALSTICQGQRLHQEQRERQESFSQRIKESRSLCQKLPESKAYDPLLS